jgi:WD40 repeat protein
MLNNDVSPVDGVRSRTDLRGPRRRRRLSGAAALVVVVWVAIAFGARAEEPVAAGPNPADRAGHSSEVTSVAFAPDGRTVATATPDTMKLWDVATGEVLRTFRPSSGAGRVAFSPDGRTIVLASHHTQLWDVASGRMLSTLSWSDKKEDPAEGLNSVAFSPDGRTLVSDGGPALWDVATGHLIKLFGGSEHVVAFSPDGHTVASAGTSDKAVKLWKLAGEGRLVRLLGHEQAVVSVAFSPDGRTVLSGSEDGTARLWDVATGEQRHVFANDQDDGYRPGVEAVAVSPDGRTVLTGTSTNFSPRGTGLKLWDVRTGKLLRTFGDAATSVVFSPDGRTVLSNVGPTLWDVSTGKMLKVFTGRAVTPELPPGVAEPEFVFGFTSTFRKALPEIVGFEPRRSWTGLLPTPGNPPGVLPFDLSRSESGADVSGITREMTWDQVAAFYQSRLRADWTVVEPKGSPEELFKRLRTADQRLDDAHIMIWKQGQFGFAVVLVDLVSARRLARTLFVMTNVPAE